MMYPSVGQYTEAIKLAEQCGIDTELLQILPHHIHQSANKIEWQVYKPERLAVERVFNIVNRERSGPNADCQIVGRLRHKRV